MSRLLTTGGGAGAYLTGPVKPIPTLLGYSAGVDVAPHQPSRPMSFPRTTVLQQEPEISDQAVADAIERLTKSPADSPEALQQAALDMELVIKHFDSLSAIFGAEAALTSLALDLAGNAEAEAAAAKKAARPARPKARRAKTERRVPAKALAR